MINNQVDNQTVSSDMSVEMQVNLGGIHMKNPVCTASGTFGSGFQFAPYLNLERLGAITTKGCAVSPWPGNPQPRMFETPSGILNSIGLQNPGAQGFLDTDGEFLEKLSHQTPVIVNVAGKTIDEYVACIEVLEQASWIAGYEINISCPNVSLGGLALGTSCADAAACTKAVRNATSKPIIMKLSPAASRIADVGAACEAAGADALSLINTIPAMCINVDTYTSELSRPTAGLSGPAIRPIAVRMVWEVAQAVTIPLLGMGGIMTGRDAAQFILAGATAVSVGTASFHDPASAERIADELAAWAQQQGVSHISELVGAFHM